MDARRPIGLEREVFGVDAGFVAVEDGDGAGLVETGFAGVTGIEVEGAADLFVVGFVAVAEDDDIGFFACDAAFGDVGKLLGIDDVVEEKFSAGELEDFGVAEVEGFIGIAGDGGHGSDVFKLEDDEGQADVASVEDVVNAFEEGGDLRVEIIVGVGDDADFHGWLEKWYVM
jgi:hypothetical protein